MFLIGHFCSGKFDGLLNGTGHEPVLTSTLGVSISMGGTLLAGTLFLNFEGDQKLIPRVRFRHPM
jgi:hypothetical protein